MAFVKTGIGDKSFELGKSVLLLSALVIGAKAWNIDLNHIRVFDVPVSQYGANVFLGMLGLVLWVTLTAYFVARVEVTLDTHLNEETKESIDNLLHRKNLLTLTIVTIPFAIMLYSAPYVLGAIAAWVIRQETIAALKFIYLHI